MMEQREKLIWMLSLLMNPQEAFVPTTAADYLFEHGVVVLPCKVGDFVYIPDPEKNVPIRVRVQGISVSVSGKPILHFGGYPVEYVWGDEYGKSWYLTEGEAKKALDRWKGGGE